mmetsp:Transcript_134330/g.258538  ORF Transcript_134330/g.258538 Transcript_134330/m.258538 type:complete len:80 (+) Transcript_134330:250-489(+)
MDGPSLTREDLSDAMDLVEERASGVVIVEDLEARRVPYASPPPAVAGDALPPEAGMATSSTRGVAKGSEHLLCTACEGE